MGFIKQIKLPDNEVYYMKNTIIPVVGTQTVPSGETGIGQWTGNIDIPSLYDGLTIAYFLPCAGSGNATLELTLSDGSTTGAINCYYNASALTTYYPANSTIIMTYWNKETIGTTDDRWCCNADYNVDTKYTASSTNTSSKIFLIGATSQTTGTNSIRTYSHDTVYVGTDGHLYSNSKQAVNLSDSQALTNKTYNGYTLADACAKGVVTSIDTSANLPTSDAVKTFVEGKGYVTTDTKNTAGSTDTSSKIYLIGATEQSANPQTYSDDQVYVTNGSLYLTKTQDASGTADNKPPLIIGNPTGQHLEFDGNEIMCKNSGTTTAPLYINNDGGTVSINNKLVTRWTSTPTAAQDSQITVVDGTNGQIKPSGYSVQDILGKIANAVHFIGSFDPSTAEGTINSGTDTLKTVKEEKGDLYIASAAGTFKGLTFEIGDSIIFIEEVAANTAVTSNDFVQVEGTTDVSNSGPTLDWGQTSTIGTVDGTDLTVTMPSNPNTDTKVTQGNTTTNNWRHIILGYNSWSSTEPSTDNVTAQVYRNNNLKINPGYGRLFLKGSSPQQYMVDTTFDLTASNNGVSSETWRALRFLDKNENNIGLFISAVDTDKTMVLLRTYNKNTGGTESYSAYLGVSVSNTGTTSYQISDTTAFKTALSLNNVTNNKQVKGLSSGTTSGHIVTWGSDGYTVADSGFTIESSVPSDAIFTDQNVVQANSSSSEFRPILTGYQSWSSMASYTTGAVTNGIYKSAKAFLRTSDGTFYGGAFVAASPISTGNISTSTKRVYLNSNGITANNYKADYSIAAYERQIIQAYAGKCPDANGLLLKIDSGGLTIVGGGESGANLAGLIADDQTVTSPARLDINNSQEATGKETTALQGSSEHLVLSSDGSIYFVTGCNTIANRVAVCLNSTRTFYPMTDNSGSIGSSTYRWANGYFTNINGNPIDWNNVINSITWSAGTLPSLTTKTTTIYPVKSTTTTATKVVSKSTTIYPVTSSTTTASKIVNKDTTIYPVKSTTTTASKIVSKSTAIYPVTSSTTTASKIVNKDTTIYPVKSTTTTATKVTTSSVTFDQITSVGTLPTLTVSGITLELNQGTLPSSSSVSINNVTDNSSVTVPILSTSVKITGISSNTDVTVPILSSSVSITEISSNTDVTVPILSASVKITGISTNTDVTVPILSSSVSITEISSNTDVTVPILSSSVSIAGVSTWDAGSLPSLTSGSVSAITVTIN